VALQARRPRITAAQHQIRMSTRTATRHRYRAWSLYPIEGARAAAEWDASESLWALMILPSVLLLQLLLLLLQFPEHLFGRR
jgi:hypothetical protein